jgi:hypothetical protein
MLIVPAGASNGGVVNLSRENLVTIIEGERTFDLGFPAEKYVPAEGDSSFSPHGWLMTGANPASPR